MTKNVSGIKSTPEPRRYLALWFPFLPTDRLQQEHLRSHGAEQDDRPRVAVEKIKGALRITAVDPRALKLGLTKGLILADARARISDIAVTSSDLQEDQRFLAYLADVCHRFTQSVALDFADGLMLDITGCAHLFDGEGHLRKRIITRLGHIGLNVRACIAGTPDAARALARYSTFEIVPPGHDEVHVKRLPVRALAAIEQDAVIALTRAGLKKLGDLSERPSHVLAARFGQNLVTCLMRTLGREDARITPLRPVFAGGPAVIAGSSPIFAANAQPGSPPNFLVVGYWGRSDEPHQRAVAVSMGKTAREFDWRLSFPLAIISTSAVYPVSAMRFGKRPTSKFTPTGLCFALGIPFLAITTITAIRKRK